VGVLRLFKNLLEEVFKKCVAPWAERRGLLLFGDAWYKYLGLFFIDSGLGEVTPRRRGASIGGVCIRIQT